MTTSLHETPRYGMVTEDKDDSNLKSSVIISLPVDFSSLSHVAKKTPTKAFERSGIYRESFQKFKSKDGFKNPCSHHGSDSQTMCKACANKYNQQSITSESALMTLMNIREHDEAEAKQNHQSYQDNIVFADPVQEKDNTIKPPEYDSIVSELQIPEPSCAEDAFGPEQLELLKIHPSELSRNELVHQYSRLQQLCKIKFDRILEVLQAQQKQKHDDEKPVQKKKELGTLIKKKKKYKPYHVSDENAIQKNTRIYRVFPEFMDALQHDTWPESTDIACWWDCHQFEGQPIPLPVRYRPRTNDFKVTGCFCSWNCVVAYNLQQKRPVCNSLIGFLYRRVTKKQRSKIKPALPRESLLMFGGPLNIEQFRRKSVDPRLSHCLLTAPLTMLRTEVEEIESQRHQASYAETIKEAIAAADAEAAKKRRKNTKKKQKPVAKKKTISQKPSKLRLRRKKPLPNEENTLFSTMGLKVEE